MIDHLDLALFQFAPRLLDVEANAARISAAARDAAADVLLTPELSLTGYDVRDAASDRRSPLVTPAVLANASGAGDVVVGLTEATGHGHVYNAAAHLRRGETIHHHRKIYLPTYGMFDEGRYFAAGDRIVDYPIADGWTAGILICEDFWHPALSYLLAARGVDVLLVMAAAPGRGVPLAPYAARFASAEVWTRIARTTAQVYGIYVALCDRVGVEGGVTFAGGSIIAAPDGDVLAAADAASETVIRARLTRAALLRARTPYAHSRDENLDFTARELRRVIEGRS